MRWHSYLVAWTAGVLSANCVRPSDERNKAGVAVSLAQANASASANHSLDDSQATGVTPNPKQTNAGKEVPHQKPLPQAHTEPKLAANKASLPDHNAKGKAVGSTASSQVDAHQGSAPAKTNPVEKPAALSAILTAEEKERQALGNGSAHDKQEQEQIILAAEEEGALASGVDTLTMAVTDPRAFLLTLPGMAHFVTGLRVAIDLQPPHLNGKCLQAGKFKGFGCSQVESGRPICQCAGMFEQCWVDERSSVVTSFSSGKKAQAFEKAKSLLFGQCYMPTWVTVVLVGGLLFALLFIGVLIYFVTRQPKSDDDADCSGSLPTFPSIPSSVSAVFLRLRGA